jgi:uncharacterized protein (DUF4415 family)
MKSKYKPSAPRNSRSTEEWNPTQKELESAVWTKGINGLPKEAQEAVRRSVGRPRAEAPKERITVRLDPEILAALRATGKGWQTLMNDVLKKWAKKHPA